MGWRRRFGRQSAASTDAVVVAIDRIRRDQAEIESRLGVTHVDAAVLHRAVRDQQRLLAAAHRQIADARMAAQDQERAAAGDGDSAAAAAYRQAVDGFGRQLDVVQATRAQLERLVGGATQNLERTHALLRDSAASLDAALRAEVELLGRLERLHRERVIAETRHRAGGSAAKS